MDEFKCGFIKCVTIMALMLNQIQVRTYHPQANSITEQIQKSLDSVLYTKAIRSNNHTSLQAKSCQLVFGRGMIHNIAFRLNYDQIQKRKQDIIN
jgi:hypothetical protein